MAAKLSANAFEASNGRLAHAAKCLKVAVFRGDLEQSSDVVFGKFVYVLRGELGEICADATGDQHFANARRLAGFTHEGDQGIVVGMEQFADCGIYA